MVIFGDGPEMICGDATTLKSSQPQNVGGPYWNWTILDLYSGCRRNLLKRNEKKSVGCALIVIRKKTV